MSDNIIDIENALIGCILTDNAVIAEIDVDQSEFLSRHTARVYGTIRTMLANGQPADVITVADEMQRVSDQDWLPVLASYMMHIVSADMAVKYAEAIRRKNRERQAIAVANDLIQDINQRGLQAIDHAVVRLMGMSVSKRSTVYDIREASRQAIELINITNECGGILGVTSGFAELDKMLGGYHKTDLIVLGARPAMGKTALLMNQVLSHSVPVGVFTTEQPAVQLALRSFSIDGGIDSAKLRSADLDESDYAKLSACAARLREARIYFDEAAQPTISDVQRQARRWRHENKVEVIHVDYIQRIKATDMRAPKHERVEEVVVGLKCLAKELDIPVVALAQVNRSVESRPDKRPNMGDLKDSGSIEQEADVIAMLYRDEVYNPETMDKGIAELNIEKNRHGPTGVVKLGWHGASLKFRDLEWRYDDGYGL
jgi:replicative DNA helicase